MTGHAVKDLHLGCSVDSGAKGLAASWLNNSSLCGSFK